MDHYDGPAFYRLKSQTLHGGSRKISKEQPKLEKKLLKKSSPKFHPSYIPPSIQAQTKKQNNHVQRCQAAARQLLEAKKEYLLFETALPHASNRQAVTEIKSLPNSGFKPVKNQTDFQKPKSAKQTAFLPATTKDQGTIQALEKNGPNPKSETPKTDTAQQNNLRQVQKRSAGKFSAAAVTFSTDVSVKGQFQLMSTDTLNQDLKLPLNLLPQAIQSNDSAMDDWVLKESEALDQALKSFHVQATVANWTIGPTVTQFELKLAAGVKVNKITNLNDDLKLALAVKDIRIEAPIPGKSSVGIEIPNLHSQPVMLAEILSSQAFKTAKSPLTAALGVDLFGQPRILDLRKMPHGLIAGATGAGKSVFINSLLLSLLYKTTAAQVRWLLIDPKAVELAAYHDLPQLLAPVISDPAAATASLKWVVEEMEERYQKLAAAKVRNIAAFNHQAEIQRQPGLKMPYILIVIDELADLMLVASSDVQNYIARITQKARAAGIHLLVATQRPSVDVVTGTIKNNIPTRIAFMVSSQTDSRTIIDTAGAERLLGKGDLLYLGNGFSQPLRLQGAYVGEEVDRITDFVRQNSQPNYVFDPAGLKASYHKQEKEDELFPQVLAYLVNEDTVSTSKLQRVFSIGYNRAAGLIDQLEVDGKISAARGSKPRKVFVKQEDLEKN
jgi:S-DNA-T family DNA segregation ATPase FtsK/SpoIIIE